MNRGFSLVELSIVLVILGLLTGGILAGRSLIRASELRSVPIDFQRYKAAAYSFRDKYFMLPGDITNATSFWGAAPGTDGTGNDAACKSVVATDARTCNGNGNGLLDNPNSSWEYYRFWQHLTNAGLIEGQYSGVSSNPLVPGTNVAASRLSNSYFSPAASNGGGNTSSFAMPVGNYMNFTATTAGSASATNGFPLLPQEAWNIDSKMDDGLPGSGTIYANKGDGTNTNCATFAGVAPPGDAGSTYVLTNTNKDCRLIYVTVF